MMNIYAQGTWDGNYIPRGDMAEATPDNALFIGHAYGQAPDGGPGLSNEATAAALEEPKYAGFLKIVSRDIYPAMSAEPTAVMVGGATNLTGSEGIGTTGELEAGYQMMVMNGLTKIVLFGQNHHKGRVGRQADALRSKVLEAGLPDFEIIIPPNQHGVFDPNSKQKWCQNEKKWRKRELLAVPYLFVKGQLK